MSNDPPNNTVIAELQARITADLRMADGCSDALRNVILSYLREGHRLGLSPSELTDFFCVSTPNIVEEAGYTDAAGDAVVALFDELHDQLRHMG